MTTSPAESAPGATPTPFAQATLVAALPQTIGSWRCGRVGRPARELHDGVVQPFVSAQAMFQRRGVAVELSITDMGTLGVVLAGLSPTPGETVTNEFGTQTISRHGRHLVSEQIDLQGHGAALVALANGITVVVGGEARHMSLLVEVLMQIDLEALEALPRPSAP